MASPLSILKTVLHLNHNRMHVISCEQKTVTVHRFGETCEQTRIYVHARPYKQAQRRCPVCGRKCPGYDTKCNTASSWRAPNLNGVPVYICYRPQRIECPEHGVLTECILGYLLTFDRLVDTSPESGLIFRPLSPVLETKLYLVWKKYQAFSPIAERFLKQIQASLAVNK